MSNCKWKMVSFDCQVHLETPSNEGFNWNVKYTWQVFHCHVGWWLGPSRFWSARPRPIFSPDNVGTSEQRLAVKRMLVPGLWDGYMPMWYPQNGQCFPGKCGLKHIWQLKSGNSTKIEPLKFGFHRGHQWCFKAKTPPSKDTDDLMGWSSKSPPSSGLGRYFSIFDLTGYCWICGTKRMKKYIPYSRFPREGICHSENVSHSSPQTNRSMSYIVKISVFAMVNSAPHNTEPEPFEWSSLWPILKHR